MKRVLLFIAAIIGGFSAANAQVTSITVETFYTGGATPTVANYPANHNTYRIYANTTNTTDRVTTVSGDANNPLALNVSGSGIWNYQVGGVTGDGATCLIYPTVPAAEYDSYLTIGITCNNDGAMNPVYRAEDPNQQWQNAAFGTTPYGDGSFVVNSPIGGAWFVLTDNASSEAGSDNKILLAQITTDGDICGTFNLQVFPNYAGAGSASINQSFEFSSNPGCVPGCMNATAVNYNPLATYDNGLCLLPCAVNAISVSALTQPHCANSNDGGFTVSATGAQSFYEFSFNGVDQGANDTGSEVFTGLSNGVYAITVRDTRFDNVLANPGGLTCVATTSVTLETPAITLLGSVGGAILCAGENNGSVSTDAANYGGGTGSLSFALFNSNGSAVLDGNNDPVVIATPNYSGLTAGSYYFVATDDNNCTAQGNTFSITSPAAIFMEASQIGVGACYNSTDVNKVITWFGGTGDVDFSLVNDGTYTIEGGPSNVTVTVSVGEHTLYARDENNCTAEYTFTVVGAPEIVINATVDGPSCNGDTDGSVTVTTTGGTGAVQYSFNGQALSSTNALSGLGNATVEVMVQDDNGCQATQTVDVVEPATLGATANVSNISCNGLTDGTISVEVVGGTFPFTYALNATPTNTDTNPVFSALAAGSYTVNVIDANGCTYVAASADAVTEPTAVEATAVAADVNCFGDASGSIEVTATGGSGTYTYSVNNGPVSASNPITGLGAGSFDVVVYDANQCSASVSGLVIAQPSAALSINGLTSNPIDEDAGGSSPYDVTGGTPTYTYSWSGPGGFTFDGQDLGGLTTAAQAGNYILTVTDANGCTATQTLIIDGVNELGRQYSISMYPNPNNGQFVMNIEGLSGDKMSYTIIDNSGRIVMSKELGNVNATRVESVDMMGAAAGIYQVRLVIGSDIRSIRFVKN